MYSVVCFHKECFCFLYTFENFAHSMILFIECKYEHCTACINLPALWIKLKDHIPIRGREECYRYQLERTFESHDIRLVHDFMRTTYYTDVHQYHINGYSNIKLVVASQLLVRLSRVFVSKHSVGTSIQSWDIDEFTDSHFWSYFL